MAVPVAAAVGAGASGLNTLTGNIFNYTEAERAQGRNIANLDHAHSLNMAMFDHQMSAQKAYDQQKYSRAVTGMRAAGLNPVLAAGGTTTASAAASGGSVGGGSGAQASGVGGHIDPLSMMTAAQQMKLMKEQARYASAQAGREEIRERLERKAANNAEKGFNMTGKGVSDFLDDAAEKAGRLFSAENKPKPKPTKRPTPHRTPTPRATPTPGRPGGLW
jgi:hypothetical protein